MDARRLVRMVGGGVACLLVAFITLVAITSLFGGNFDTMWRVPAFVGAPLLLVLATEMFVLTVAGLILLIWATVAAIAGPPAAMPTTVRDESPTPRAVMARTSRAASADVPAPVTPTAMVDPHGGFEERDTETSMPPDPVKRRPPQD